MRLEWRVLAAALVARTMRERRRAIADALDFRERRRHLAPGGGELERQLELNEGLAEYTGVRLSGQNSLDVAARLAQAEHEESFAYASGPAYGFLLDEFRPNWRQQGVT